MPATAGRIRMPANNRVHSSAALQTHSIWQSAIRYDPYAPATTNTTNNPKPDTDNVYNSFQDLLTLARITGSNTSETRGACKKCHRVGHLTFQCRNFLSLKPKSDDADVIYQTKNADPKEDDVIKKAKEDSEEEEDDEVEISSSDSDVDPEMERIIAERFGKSMSKMSKIDDDDDEERKKRKERSRSRHHRRRHRHHRRRHRRSKRERDSDDSSSSESSPDEGYEKRSERHRRKRRTSHRERRSVLSSGSESTGSSSDEDERRRRERRERKLSCVAR